MPKLFSRLTGIEEREAGQVIWAFLCFFCVLSAYFILQPLRDEMGLVLGKDYLPSLFRWSLLLVALANPVYSWAVNRFPRIQFIRLSYRFFAANILFFIVVLKYLEAQGLIQATGESALTGWAFFIPAFFYLWVGVFSLFGVSIFYALLADVYDGEASKKIFGFVGAGGTLGQAFGSFLTAHLVKVLGPTNLLFVSMILLECAVFCMHRLTRNYVEPEREETEKPNIFTGARDTLRTPYLLGICAYLFLYTFTSSFLYFQKQEIVAELFAARDAKVAFFAKVNLAVSVCTSVVQLFLTGRLLPLMGLKVGLALVPTITVLGFLYLAKAPGLLALAVFEVARKTVNYAISRPCREILFTAVNRRQKFLSKGFIDTFVYRAGDFGASLAVDGLKALAFGFAAISFAAVPCSVLWLGVGVGLGWAHKKRMESPEFARSS